MKNRFLNTILLAFLIAFGINELSAQDNNAKTKVVVIEKTVDSDGNVKVMKKVTEGKDAEAILKEHDLEEENVIIESDSSNKKIKMKNHYRVITKGDDGEEEVFEWNGQGDMPEDLEKRLKEEGFEVEQDNFSKKQVIVKVIDSEDENEIITIDEDGDIEKHVEVEVIKNHRNRKAQLGVMIKDSEKGAEVVNVVEGSPAEKNGIKPGDIITRIDDSKIEGVESLVNYVSQRNPDSEIEIEFLRNDEPVVQKVILQKPDKVFEDYEMEDEDVEEIIIIKKKD